jgi:hypothetical protein
MPQRYALAMRLAAALAVVAVLLLGAAACGDDSSGSNFLVVTGKPIPDTASASDIARWVATWCSLKVGMTAGAVKHAMGPPSAEDEDSGYPHDGQIIWAGKRYMFSAYTQDGRVDWLVTDAGSVSGVPALPCPSSRTAAGLG